MTTLTTIFKTVTKRAWSDLEPKLLAFLATGLSASLVIEAANYIGYPINPGLAAVIATCIGSIAGYFKSSTVAGVALPAPTPTVPAAPTVPVEATTTIPASVAAEAMAPADTTTDAPAAPDPTVA